MSVTPFFSEVPLSSNEHIEDTEISLFDAERDRAFKILPTPFFFCSSYEVDAGWGKVLSKQLSNWNPSEQKWSWPEDPGTLKYPCKERRQGKSWETLKMMGFPHIVLLFMGSPRISGLEKACFGSRTQQTGFPHRVPCLDACWATRKKKMSKKHETRVNKAVKTWLKTQAPTTIFSADFLSGEICHEEHTSFPFLSTKNFPDALPWFTTKRQLVSCFVTTQAASFISFTTNEPWNSADKKTKPEATNLILVIQSC